MEFRVNIGATAQQWHSTIIDEFHSPYIDKRNATQLFRAKFIVRPIHDLKYIVQFDLNFWNVYCDYVSISIWCIQYRNHLNKTPVRYSKLWHYFRCRVFVFLEIVCCTNCVLGRKKQRSCFQSSFPVNVICLLSV